MVLVRNMNRLLHIYTYLLLCLLASAQDKTGTMPGTFSVSSNGAATYTIPIVLRDGYSEFTPKISLTYNSQAGNGVAGYGWNISGLSSITAIPHTVYFDSNASSIRINSNDAYALDGQRLLLKSGTNGKKNAEYTTEEELYYKINIDSAFTATPKSFVVRHPDGSIFRYGSTSKGICRYPSSSSKKAFGWLLDYAEDANGNYIKYIYAYDNNTPYLTQIRYGANKNISTAYCAVLFTYENRTDTITSYLKNTKYLFTKRLASITCQYFGTQYRKYVLSYAANSSPYSHITSIKELGNAETGYPATIFTWEDLPSISMARQSLQVSKMLGTNYDEYCYFSGDVDNDGITELISLRPSSTSSSDLLICKQTNNHHFDNTQSYTLSSFFDEDICGVSNRLRGGIVAHFQRSQENSIVIPTLFKNSSNQYMAHFEMPKDGVSCNLLLAHTTEMPAYTIADFDKDGIDQIVTFEKTKPSSKKLRFTLIDVNMQQTTLIQNSEQVLTLSSLTTTQCNEKVKDCLAADFDGDGMTDLLVLYPNYSILLWNENGLFNATNSTVLTNIKSGDTMQIADFNADGLPDLIMNETSSTTWKQAINQGVRSTAIFALSNISPLNSLGIKKQGSDDDGYFCLVQDINADGLSDMVIGYKNGNAYKTCWVTLDHSGIFSITHQHAVQNPSYRTLGYQLATGDFDGDGCPEIVNFGSNLLTGESATERWWHIYSNQSFVPDYNKITTITDGIGKTTSIIYRSLLDNYSNNKQTTFPLMKFYAPISVVDKSIVSWRTTNYQTIYGYTDGIYHAQGKGFLGFMNQSHKAEGLSTIISHDINNTYPSPHLVQKRTTDATGHLAYQHIYQYSYGNGDVPKSFIRHLIREDEKDIIGNKESHVSYSNFHHSTPESVSSGTNIRTSTTTTYTDITSDGKWILSLPTTIETEKETDDFDGNTDTSVERVTCTYDNSGRLSQRQSYKGLALSTCSHVKTELFQYNNGGKLISTGTKVFTSSDTLTSSNTYNTRGQLTKTVAADGHPTQYAYNTLGLQSSETDGWFSTKSFFSYDTVGRHTRTIRKSTANAFTPDTLSISYSLSSLPQYAYQVKTTHTHQPMTIQYYDGFGREAATGEIHFDGREFVADRHFATADVVDFETVPHLKGSSTDIGTTYIYDSFFRPVEIIDPEDKTTEYSYDERYKQVIENGVSTEYLFNEDGLLSNRYDDKGSINYFYKATGDYDKIELDYMEGNPVYATFIYDKYGRLKQLTTPNGDVRKYWYNSKGYVSQHNIGGGNETFTYNKYGDITRKTYYPQGTSATATYTYDSKRQLLSVSGPHFSESYSYNASGQMTNKQRSVTVEGETYSKSSSYAYNGENQLLSITNTLGGVSFPVVENYGYSRGWRTNIHLNNHLVWQLNSEDARGRTASTSDRLGTSTYTYDNCGRITSSHTSVSSTTTGGNESFSHTYAYDEYGRIATKDGKDFTYDDYNQLETWNGRDYSFDARGNITMEGAQGGITYDGYKLKKVTSPTTNVWGNFTLDFIYSSSLKPYCIEYKRQSTPWGRSNIDYDAEGNRISMVKNGYLVPEMVENGELVPPVEENDFIRAYIDDRYDMETWAPSYKPTHYYYVGGDPLTACAVAQIYNNQLRLRQIYRDEQGSITELADSIEVQRYHYDPWGRYCNASGDMSSSIYGKGGDMDNPFYRGYLGQEFITGYGLYNLNARLYDPFTGRFLSPDPVFDTSGSIFGFNPYIYGNNCPSVYVDPDGEFAFTIITGALEFFKNIGEHGFHFDDYTWDMTSNAFKIDRSMFQGDFLQILNKWTWGSLASFTGNFIAHGYNLMGKVDNVTILDGMAALSGPTGSTYHSDGRANEKAVTIGHYSMGPKGYKADWRDHLFVHEYGHYIQSQQWGPLYFPAIALPSLFSTIGISNIDHDRRWFEINANKLGANYFDKHYGSGAAGYTIGSSDYFDKKTFWNGGDTPYINPRLQTQKQFGTKLPTNPKYTIWDFLIL